MTPHHDAHPTVEDPVLERLKELGKDQHRIFTRISLVIFVLSFVGALFVISLLVFGGAYFNQRNVDERNRVALAETVERNRVAICQSDEALTNGSIDSMRPKDAEEARQMQARVDGFKIYLERALSSLNCDLHLVAVPAPKQEAN